MMKNDASCMACCHVVAEKANGLRARDEKEAGSPAPQTLLDAGRGLPPTFSDSEPCTQDRSATSQHHCHLLSLGFSSEELPWCLRESMTFLLFPQLCIQKGSHSEPTLNWL